MKAPRSGQLTQYELCLGFRVTRPPYSLDQLFFPQMFVAPKYVSPSQKRILKRMCIRVDKAEKKEQQKYIYIDYKRQEVCTFFFDYWSKRGEREKLPLSALHLIILPAITGLT